MEADKDNLNPYSCFERQQLELFCVTQEEVDHIRETDAKLYKNKRGKLLQDRWDFVASTASRILSFPGTL